MSRGLKDTGNSGRFYQQVMQHQRADRYYTFVQYAFIAAALIVNGASYIIAGITGVITRPVGLGLGGRARRSWESDAA